MKKPVSMRHIGTYEMLPSWAVCSGSFFQISRVQAELTERTKQIHCRKHHCRLKLVPVWSRIRSPKSWFFHKQKWSQWKLSICWDASCSCLLSETPV